MKIMPETKTWTESALSDHLAEFLSSFKKNGEYIYVDQIDEMQAKSQTFLMVDFVDFSMETELEEYFLKNPDVIMEAFARAIRQVLGTRFPDYAKRIKNEITVRITNFPNKCSVREINADNSGQYITIKGMLIRMSAVESIPVVSTYQCTENHITVVKARRDFTTRVPVQCNKEKCKQRDLELVPQQSTFVDYQILQLQELPGELPAGQLPRTLGVFVSGNLVDSARMGDTVEISGVIRPEVSHKIKLGVPVQTYRHRLYAKHIEQISNENDFGGVIDEEDIKKITKHVTGISEEHARETIINSFAPHIHGHDLIKEALILTMIGSDSYILEDGTNVRGDINIFLVGDPGTAKSEMGKAAYRVAPRSFYTSGRGSSGAGLTAAVVQDSVTQTWMLEPGVLVLADKGLAIIDEFDKMKAEDRSALHEVMEQQSVSISKAGIMATLNTRTTIIAIANPTLGRYDIYRNLTENIPSIPIPLLTRFDMIFIVRDLPEKEKDRKIARHIVAYHNNEALLRNKSYMDIETFAKYLRIAKEVHPILSNGATQKIIDYYIMMRNSTDEDSGYPITPRQLEGLIRLTTAHAKALLKPEAEESDADRAIYILGEMFKSSGVDVNTGKVDVGVLEGKPKSEVNKIKLFMDIMKGLTDDNKVGAKKKIILEEMIKSEKWDEATASKFLQRMGHESLIYESTVDHWNMVS